MLKLFSPTIINVSRRGKIIRLFRWVGKEVREISFSFFFIFCFDPAFRMIYSRFVSESSLKKILNRSRNIDLEVNESCMDAVVGLTTTAWL
jgi:hypothetical protein